MTVDLRLGRWQDVLADVECDALITDPPYSARTHARHDSGAADSNGPVERPDVRDNRARQRLGLPAMRQHITYDSWSELDVSEFVDHWSPRTRGWVCVITDSSLFPVFSAALEAHGRYVFSPVPIVEVGSRIRLAGDGPSSWTCWLIVARPKTRDFQRWGTLPGAYIGSGRGDREHIGGKDSTIMRAIVRDYSRPGDLVCDPCAGAATTLLAAAMEGRRAVGSEMDPATLEKAQTRIARGFTPTLFDADRPMVQRSLLGSDE